MPPKKGKEPEPVVEAAPVVEGPTGKGTFTFEKDFKYSGEFKDINGVKFREGFGNYSGGGETYEGYWKDDQMSGRGKYTFASGAYYDGEFEMSKFNGQGIYMFIDGARYEGNWLQGKMHGEGTYTDSNQVEWEGTFYNGSFDSGIVSSFTIVACIGGVE